MAEFVSSIAWVSADRDAPSTDDRKNNERVNDRVKTVDTDCVTLLQACIVETGDQATDRVFRCSVSEVD